MKVITEAIVRDELRNTQPETYYIPEGKLLSPAAREYLQQRKIKIAKGDPVAPAPAAAPVAENAVTGVCTQAKPNYEDYVTGAYYNEKPEHMTQLHDNVLVPKDHPRILFRGKLDSLQAQVVLAQALIAQGGGCEQLLRDLSGILDVLREMMRCDVLEDEFRNNCIIGLSHAELRERSHNPMQFYKVKQMVLPNYSFGVEYALLNQVRTAIRECEVAATGAFHDGARYLRRDIIEGLNRLSSALHIMMCKYMAGDYTVKK